ncbi:MULTISPECIES: FkbM family methyltransferase [Hyphomicrobiales]|jgi:FkbM family methyltransferase|uniref:FkbM family methyltransferase n=1 Tax=Bosea massiliensis TaxID=151419 RepID=A0ABW0P2T3_9HYPH|nr:MULTISPECIES: FkbM family methyltransferase [Hyphomicrobiales]
MLNKVLKKTAARALAHATDRPALRRLLFNALRLRRSEIMAPRQQDAIRFLGYVFDRLDKSRSQILQDLWVCYELGDQRDGFFVEFGATNGLTNSNSWLLEKQFGWNGILAEPNPLWHDDLYSNRGCIIDKRCVFSSSGESLSFVATEDPELAGIAVTAEHDHFAAIRRAAPSFEVATISLNDLLEEHRAPAVIDYMSIDTEGSELAILQAFDFERWRVRLLSVEHSHSPQEAKIDALLAAKGFRRKFPEYSQWDGWYVRGEGAHQAARSLSVATSDR